MLEMRPVCECCAKPLPNESEEAMICTFECTFCKSCVEGKLQNVCPNCGGGFEKRPTRPKAELGKYPVETVPLVKPINEEKYKIFVEKYKDIPPHKR